MSERRDLYEKYLLSEHWEHLRRAAFEIARYQCEACGCERDLEGHHLQYRNLFDCTTEDIMCVCYSCHKRWHSKHTSYVVATRERVIEFLNAPAPQREKRTKPKISSNQSPKLDKKARKAQLRKIKAAFQSFISSSRNNTAVEAMIAALRDFQAVNCAKPSEPAVMAEIKGPALPLSVLLPEPIQRSPRGKDRPLVRNPDQQAMMNEPEFVAAMEGMSREDFKRWMRGRFGATNASGKSNAIALYDRHHR